MHRSYWFAVGELMKRERQAETFDFQAGDVSYIQKSNGHYIENVGTGSFVHLSLLSAA